MLWRKLVIIQARILQKNMIPLKWQEAVKEGVN